MQALDPGFDIEHFFAGLAAATARALLLDYDGTLAPFRVERVQALPYLGVNAKGGKMDAPGLKR